MVIEVKNAHVHVHFHGHLHGHDRDHANDYASIHGHHVILNDYAHDLYFYDRDCHAFIHHEIFIHVY